MSAHYDSKSARREIPTVDSCLCGAPPLGESALADEHDVTAHPQLCAGCSASIDIAACRKCGRIGRESDVLAHGYSAHVSTARRRGTLAGPESVAEHLEKYVM